MVESFSLKRFHHLKQSERIFHNLFGQKCVFLLFGMNIQLFSLSGVKNEYFIYLHLRPILKFYNCKNDVSQFSVTVSRPYMIDDVMRIKMAVQ